METHGWAARGSLGWVDGDASSPGQLGGPLGSCRALHWEIRHPTCALGQMEHPEMWPGQTFTFLHASVSPSVGKRKRTYVCLVTQDLMGVDQSMPMAAPKPAQVVGTVAF